MVFVTSEDDLIAEVTNMGSDQATVEFINGRPSGGDKRGTYPLSELVYAHYDWDKDSYTKTYANGGGVGESDDCPEYFMEVEGDTQKAYELLKKARWFDETSTRVYNDLEDIKGFVSNDKESLSRAETYLDSKGISTSVIYNLKEKFWADLDEESTGDQNWVWNTMYFAIRDRIDPEYDINTMSLVETANENALNSGLIYGIEELGKRPLYKEISATALKNILKLLQGILNTLFFTVCLYSSSKINRFFFIFPLHLLLIRETIVLSS